MTIITPVTKGISGKAVKFTAGIPRLPAGQSQATQGSLLKTTPRGTSASNPY